MGKHLCPAVLRADEVEEHEAACPHEAVTCGIPGCGAVMLKRSLQRHMRDNAPSHVEALLAANSALEGELMAAKGALGSALARVATLEGELSAASSMAEMACGALGAPARTPAQPPRKRPRSLSSTPTPLKVRLNGVLML